MTEKDQEKIDQLSKQLEPKLEVERSMLSELEELRNRKSDLRLTLSGTRQWTAELRQKSLFRKPLATEKEVAGAQAEIKKLEAELELAEAHFIELRDYALPALQREIEDLRTKRNSIVMVAEINELNSNRNFMEGKRF